MVAPPRMADGTVDSKSYRGPAPYTPWSRAGTREHGVPADTICNRRGYSGGTLPIDGRWRSASSTALCQRPTGPGRGGGKTDSPDLAALKPGFGAYFRDWFDQQRSAWDQSRDTFDRDQLSVLL